PVPRAVRRRVIWLAINMVTAFLASAVVGRFSSALEQIVALAILMPIVAGMGGNAGTQVLTLMIRGLALGQVGASNLRALGWKEVRVAALTGRIMGGMVGLVSFAWFHDWTLALVIGAALLSNFLTGALTGVLAPAILKRLNLDP